MSLAIQVILLKHFWHLPFSLKQSLCKLDVADKYVDDVPCIKFLNVLEWGIQCVTI